MRPPLRPPSHLPLFWTICLINGVVFVLGATGSILLLASNPPGSESLRDLLVGQILWVAPRRADQTVSLSLWR